MINFFFRCLLIAASISAFSSNKAISETILSIKQTQYSEFKLLSKDVFQTLHPDVYDLTLENADNSDTPISVNIELTKPFLLNGATEDPKGTKLTAELSFIDSSGDKKILSIDGDDNQKSIIADLKPGITKLMLTMEADRPREYFGGSYEYNFTLTVEPE